MVFNYDMPETDAKHGNGADTYLHRVSNSLLYLQSCRYSIVLCNLVSSAVQVMP